MFGWAVQPCHFLAVGRVGSVLDSCSVKLMRGSDFTTRRPKATALRRPSALSSMYWAGAASL